MSSPSDHPDDVTLRAWLAFELSDEKAHEIEQHIESCQQCADRVSADKTPSGLEGRLRAIARGENVTRRAEPEIELVNQSAQGETLATPDHDTNAWKVACSSATEATMTIKTETSAAEVTSLHLPIRPRLLHSEDEKELKNDSLIESDYHLLDVIGRGGMGVVYSARQSSMDRLVAVKMLTDRKKDEASRKRLFLQEAIVTADLDHPNIVPVHELGSNQQGAVFYSMKQVKGTPWSKAIALKSEEENLNILMRVADAVAFAHSRGIIHRDLKPENVMLGNFGEVWLMDWGLAFPTDECTKSNVIRASRLGGTPAYMAPEMASSADEIGPATDIYLLGAILFEIVVGIPPHRGKTVMECLLAARRNEIVPTNERSDLLPIAYQAMESSPAHRFQNVQAFQAAVRHWMTHNESLAMAETASEVLQSAEENHHYQDYVRAIFGFEQAHTLFPENPNFGRQLTDAKFSYARCAAGNGDFDLAASLLDRDLPDHSELLAQVEESKREQEARATRLVYQQRAFKVMIAVTLLLILGAAGVAQWLRSSALQLANTNEPAINASLSLQSGLRRSLSALRGWVALGDERFKLDRSDAWTYEIRPSLKRLHELADRDGTKQDRQSLVELDSKLRDLYETQWWIEDVAQTPGNEPSRNLFLRDVTPVESTISAALESLIQLEQNREDSSSEESTWPQLSQLQLVFAKCHRRLTALVETGDDQDRMRFETLLKQVQDSLDAITTSEVQLTDQQRDLVRWMKDEFGAYRALSIEVSELRRSDEANVAQWRLATEAMPKSQLAEKSLNEIVEHHQQATVRNSQQINAVSKLAVSFAVAVGIGAIVVAWLMVFRNSAARALQAGAVCLCLAAILSSSATSYAQEPRDTATASSSNSVQPPDVYRNVMLVIDELELIRVEMGKPKYIAEELPISNANPHEVYFQALTLHLKTDQLCFELMRNRMPAPEPPADIDSAQVLMVVKSVLRRLTALKQKLGIMAEAELQSRDASKTPTDVFRAILNAKRQVNLMVEKRFSSSDVFQQVTLAVSYSSELLALFPDATRLPDPPVFEPRKTPADVAAQLFQCLARIRNIAETSKVDMLKYDDTIDPEKTVEPSDVYDLASLVVSELAHLHSLHGDSKQPRRVFAPGPLFPSHVFQRARMLDKQLQELESRVEMQPEWLSR